MVGVGGLEIMHALESEAGGAAVILFAYFLNLVSHFRGFLKSSGKSQIPFWEEGIKEE